MSYTSYTTKDGDRWDSIAYAAYGDPLLAQEIMASNPRVSKSPVLSGGISLNIPIKTPDTINSNLLPPWKR